MGRLLQALWQQWRQRLGLDRQAPVERPLEPAAPQPAAPQEAPPPIPPPAEAHPSGIPREYRRTPNPAYGKPHAEQGRRRA